MGWSANVPKIRAVRLHELVKPTTDCRTLEGYIVFNSMVRAGALDRILPGPAIRYKANSTDAHATFVSQEPNRTPNGIVIEIGAHVTSASVRSSAGKLAQKMGVDYEQAVATLPDGKQEKASVIEQLVDGRNFAEIVMDNPSVLTDNITTLQRNAELLHAAIRENDLKEWAKGVTLRPWQQSLEEELKGTPDGRQITVYLDREGDTGKSFYIKYRKAMYPSSTLLLSSAKTESMLHAASKVYNPDVVFLDLYKTETDQVNYGAIEAIKNGHFMSGKYDSGEIIWSKCPHFIVLTNEELQWDKMMMDRWCVRDMIKMGDDIQIVKKSIK